MTINIDVEKMIGTVNINLQHGQGMGVIEAAVEAFLGAVACPRIQEPLDNFDRALAAVGYFKTIYLAGKVSGLDQEHVEAKFSRSQAQLEAAGHKVINPVQVVEAAPGLKQADWQTIMKACLSVMMTCDEVHLLPCWQDSPGAMLERDVAMRLGLPIIYR